MPTAADLFFPVLSSSHTPTLGEILLFLLLGALAGWLAGLLMRGGGFGLIANIIIGIVGAIIGGWLLGLVGIGFGGWGFWGALLTALIGAIVLLFVAGILGKIIR